MPGVCAACQRAIFSTCDRTVHACRLPSDTSFRAYETALAHVMGPPRDPVTEFYWSQGLLDVRIE